MAPPNWKGQIALVMVWFPVGPQAAARSQGDSFHQLQQCDDFCTRQVL